MSSGRSFFARRNTEPIAGNAADAKNDFGVALKREGLPITFKSHHLAACKIRQVQEFGLFIVNSGRQFLAPISHVAIDVIDRTALIG